MVVRLLKQEDLDGLVSLEQELFDNPFGTQSCLEELTENNRLYLGIFNDGVLYYGLENMEERAIQIYTITKEGYEVETINF